MAKAGRPKEENTIATQGGPGTITVSKETREKLKEKARGIPLSRYLKGIADSEYELKPDPTPQDLVEAVNQFAALIASLPKAAFLDFDYASPDKLQQRGEKITAYEKQVINSVRVAFSKVRQAELPTIDTPDNSAPEVV